MNAHENAFPRSLKLYLTGFALALVLTAIPFALVATAMLPERMTLLAIAAAAIAQLFVHLRFFLHLDWRSTPGENLLALAFAAVLVFIMIGGSLWIMTNLHYRMGI